MPLPLASSSSNSLLHPPDLPLRPPTTRAVNAPQPRAQLWRQRHASSSPRLLAPHSPRQQQQQQPDCLPAFMVCLL